MLGFDERTGDVVRAVDVPRVGCRILVRDSAANLPIELKGAEVVGMACWVPERTLPMCSHDVEGGGNKSVVLSRKSSLLWGHRSFGSKPLSLAASMPSLSNSHKVRDSRYLMVFSVIDMLLIDGQ